MVCLDDHEYLTICTVHCYANYSILVVVAVLGLTRQTGLLPFD